jgi:hypothetical protein
MDEMELFEVDYRIVESRLDSHGSYDHNLSGYVRWNL